MPKLMRDFVCNDCGETIERFIDAEISTIECDCGGAADRVIGLPTISLEGITGSFPGAYERWAKIREDKARQGNGKKN